MNNSSDSTAATCGAAGSFSSGGNGSGSGSDNTDNQGSGFNQSNDSDNDDANSEKSIDSPSNKGQEKARRKSKPLPFKSKLPKKATDILRQWFLNNLKHPYPTHEDKEILSKATGLTRKQIQNWFTNTRKVFLSPILII